MDRKISIDSSSNVPSRKLSDSLRVPSIDSSRPTISSSRSQSVDSSFNKEDPFGFFSAEAIIKENNIKPIKSSSISTKLPSSPRLPSISSSSSLSVHSDPIIVDDQESDSSIHVQDLVQLLPKRKRKPQPQVDSDSDATDYDRDTA